MSDQRVCQLHAERLIKLEIQSEQSSRHISELKHAAYGNRERLIALCGEDGRNGMVGALRSKMAKIEETADKLEEWLSEVKAGRAGDRARIALIIGILSTAGAILGSAVVTMLMR